MRNHDSQTRITTIITWSKNSFLRSSHCSLVALLQMCPIMNLAVVVTWAISGYLSEATPPSSGTSFHSHLHPRAAFSSGDCWIQSEHCFPAASCLSFLLLVLLVNQLPVHVACDKAVQWGNYHTSGPHVFACVLKKWRWSVQYLAMMTLIQTMSDRVAGVQN